MTRTERLREELAPRRLEHHPYYQSWSLGSLSRAELRVYAAQYFRHVAAFPRYVSATHSRCPDIRARQVLLRNLVDEESGPDHHPELWLRFAAALGCSRAEVESASPLPETSALVDAFFSSAYASYAEGLGALFAYEDQVPAVAALKSEALDRHYGVSSEGRAFFDVHARADVWHSAETSALLDALEPAAGSAAESAAKGAADALWLFLDAMARR